MDAQRNGSTVAFSGILDERSSSDAMRHVISQAMAVATGPGARVQLDLSHVKRANSCGILMWFKLLRERKSLRPDVDTSHRVNIYAAVPPGTPRAPEA